MKRIFTILALLTTTLPVFAQTDTTGSDTLKNWTITGGVAVLFNQVGLYRWQGGGEPSLSLGIIYKGDFNYNNHKGWTVDNYIHVAYGVIRSGRGDLEKSDDRWEIGTQVGRSISKRWSANVFANLKSQFTDGFEPEARDIRISTFMAPGYFFSGAAAEYKYNDWFYANLSPFTYKGTFVLDPEIADINVNNTGIGKYGNKTGEQIRNEFGLYGMVGIKKELVKNVFIDTKAEFFSNYENIGTFTWDVFWDLTFILKVNNWLATSVTMNFIYDEDIPIIQEVNNAGEPVHIAPSVQLKETVGIGVTLTY